MQYELYTALKTQIETYAAIQHVDLWNNQIERENVEITFAYPAVFIEFANINYTDQLKGVQSFEMDVIIHIVDVSYEKTNTNILQLKQNVNAYIQLFTEGYHTRMLRRNDTANYDHTNVQEWMTTYHISGKDFSVNSLPTTEATIDTIDLNLDPQITNHIINTGILP